MLQFKHPHDLKQLPEAHPVYPLVKDLVERLIVDYQPPGVISAQLPLPSLTPLETAWTCRPH